MHKSRQLAGGWLYKNAVQHEAAFVFLDLFDYCSRIEA